MKGGECTVQRLSTIAPDEVITDKVAVSNDYASTSTKKTVKSKKSRNPTKKRGNGNSQKKKGEANSKKQVSKLRTKKQKEQKVYKPLKDLTLGSFISGKVVEVCEFGAFVDIGYASRGSRPGTALLHISQIQDAKVSTVTDILNKGDTIEDARVIKVDYIKGEVGISLRKRCTVCEADDVCKVATTTWPVSEACNAISAVSPSRISPMMMTSGA